MLFVDHELIAGQQDRQPGSLGLEEQPLEKRWLTASPQLRGSPSSIRTDPSVSILTGSVTATVCSKISVGPLVLLKIGGTSSALENATRLNTQN
jgi:hypothetical protein